LRSVEKMGVLDRCRFYPVNGGDTDARLLCELERLRLLKEHELGVRVEYDHGDPYVVIEK
jgi:hypothetical protein